MSTNIKVWLMIAIMLLYLDVIVICIIIIKRLKHNKSNIISEEQKNILLNTESSKGSKKTSKAVVTNYFQMKQVIQLDKHKTESIEKYANIDRIEKKYLKRLKSIFKTTKIEAAVYLGVTGTDRARLA